MIVQLPGNGASGGPVEREPRRPARSERHDRLGLPEVEARRPVTDTNRVRASCPPSTRRTGGSRRSSARTTSSLAWCARRGSPDVDILLVPSSDWDSVAAWHAQQAPFRAVENGVALVRPTRQGISLATDGQGRLLGYKPDYFVSDEQTLVVSVPTQGNDTWYVAVGDVFAYASAVGLLVLAGDGSPTEATPAGPAKALGRASSDQTEGSAQLDRLLT